MLIRRFAASSLIASCSHYRSYALYIIAAPSPFASRSHHSSYIYHATWTYRRSNAIRFALALRGSQARSLPASLAVQLNHGTPFSPKGLRPNLHKRLPLLSPPARGRAYYYYYYYYFYYFKILCRTCFHADSKYHSYNVKLVCLSIFAILSMLTHFILHLLV